MTDGRAWVAMCNRVAAILAVIVAFGSADSALAAPRLEKKTESAVLSSAPLSLGLPSVTLINIGPFDTSLGLLKEVDVGIAGATEVAGTFFTGDPPNGSNYFAELSQSFTGTGDSFFDFASAATAQVLGLLAPVDSAQSVFQRKTFNYSFSFDETMAGSTFSTSSGSDFGPPNLIVGEVGAFLDDNATGHQYDGGLCSCVHRL